MSHQPRRSDLDSFFRSVYDSLARKVLEADTSGKSRRAKAASREDAAPTAAPRAAATTKARTRARSSGR